MRNILLLLTTLLFVISCDDSTGNSDPISGVFKNLERGGDTNTEYTYFDFSEEKIHTSTEPSTDSKWDVGFGRGFFGMADDGQGGQRPDYRSVIVTNGGSSGAASGGGYLMTDVSFDEVSEIPENIDAMITTDKVSNGIMDPALKTGSGTWYNYDFVTHNLVPNPNAVLIVKTPSGKYVKMSIISLYELDDQDVPDYGKYGYISFRYEYLD